MRQPTRSEITASVVNSSRSRIKSMSFPDDFDRVRWEDLDFYGWIDPRAPHRAYLVTEYKDRLVGVEFRAAGSDPSRSRGAGESWRKIAVLSRRTTAISSDTTAIRFFRATAAASPEADFRPAATPGLRLRMPARRRASWGKDLSRGRKTPRPALRCRWCRP